VPGACPALGAGGGLDPLCPGFIAPTKSVTLKMNLPNNCSRLIEDWVTVIVCPGCNMVLSPPAERDT
jgi:hypothetical protein